MVKASDHHHVLQAAQFVVHGDRLADHSDAAANPIRFTEHVIAGHGYGTAVRLQQRGEDPDRGGLSGPVRAEHREYAASLDLEVEIVQHLLFTKGLGDSPCMYYAFDHCRFS
jgi:hypothetical protein